MQLKREFRAVSDLAHPNLAHVYELACEDGLWFFAMELIEGVDFRQWWRGDNRSAEGDATTIREVGLTIPNASFARHDPTCSEFGPDAGLAFSPERLDELRAALVELVEGVGALHDAGLRHGDIKPKNVLVREDGSVVVVDFGLVRPVGSKRPAEATSGTPAYMAPEQITGSDSRPASDWYAVGTMLYELLTGHLPFAGKDLVDLYAAKITQPPRPPHEVAAGVPRDLSNLCLRLLRPEPEWRPDQKELLAVLSGNGPTQPLRDARRRSALVGREPEIGALSSAYQQAASGHCVVVHVHGPSGIGKSSVVQSFLESIRDATENEILRGRCYERESVPYKAFDGIVDELTSHLLEMGSRTDALLPEWTPELARVFPALSAIPAVVARGAPAARSMPKSSADEPGQRCKSCSMQSRAAACSCSRSTISSGPTRTARSSWKGCSNIGERRRCWSSRASARPKPRTTARWRSTSSWPEER